MSKLIKPQRTNKHKKLKNVDPFYKGPRPIDRKTALANQPPGKNADDDYADIPYSMKELMKGKQQAKNAGKRKRNKFKNLHREDMTDDPMYKKTDKGMTRPIKPIPVFKQHKGESERSFIYRMDKETQEVISRTQFEDKFDVEVNKTKSGEYKIEKRKGVEGIDDDIGASKKQRRNKKKLEKKKNMKKNNLLKKVENFEEFHDEVQFGEVAMAPPTLTAKPRKIYEEKTNRPGTKSLLLKNIVQTKSSEGSAASQRSVGQTLKRKHMSIAEQRILDTERERAIEMYRQIKKKKREGRPCSK